MAIELLAEAARQRSTRVQGAPPWLRQAREMIIECVPETLQLAQIAAAVGVHPVYLATTCGSRCPDSGGTGGEYSKDGTTEGNFMAKEFLASRKLPLRFYLTAGTFEVDREGTGGGILETTRQLRDVLLAKGYDVQYQQFVGGHDGLSWRGSLADGLMALLGPR